MWGVWYAVRTTAKRIAGAVRIGNGGGGRRGLGFEQVGHFLEVDYFLTGRRIYVYEVPARGSVGMRFVQSIPSVE